MDKDNVFNIVSVWRESDRGEKTAMIVGGVLLALSAGKLGVEGVQLHNGTYLVAGKTPVAATTPEPQRPPTLKFCGQTYECVLQK